MNSNILIDVRGVPRWHLLMAILGIICIRVLWLMLYRLLFHPLARFPGPISYKLSYIPIIFSAAQARETYTRYDLHKKYGNVVRTGPNELCFADSASIKDIYGQSAQPCIKAPYFYKGFTLTGTNSVFSATDRLEHSRMRRLVSHGFSQQGVLQLRGEIITNIEKFLGKLRTSSQPCDVHDHIINLYLDMTSQLSFAESFRFLEGKTHQGARDIQTYFSIAPIFGTFPLAKYLPFGIFRAAKQVRPRIVKSVQASIDSLREKLQHGTTQNSMLGLMMEAEDSETSTKLLDEELIENAVIFTIAGSGTTATTLMYVIYELGKRPEMQKRLESDIREAFPNQSEFPSFEVATDLPYLNCVLQEVLRLRGPIQTNAPRMSPGKIIGGHFIPAGVIVSNLPYATHRDPEAFPQPDRFLPDRWEQPTPFMKIMHRPFQTGPRNCVGMHLARVELLLTICSLYQRFDIELDSRMTDEMMILRDQGLMDPIGKQLWITAKQRKTS